MSEIYAVIGLIVWGIIAFHKWVSYKRLTKELYTAALREPAFSLAKRNKPLIEKLDSIFRGLREG